MKGKENLDEAYVEEVGRLFGVLVCNLVEGVESDEALRRFSRGLAAVKAAYELARAQIK